jgi:diguanylate cyclase (GGDEF)-like protein
MLHLPTLLIAVALAAASSAIFVLLLARMSPGTRGVWCVVLATVFAALGLPLMAVREMSGLPQIAGIWLTNALFIGALAAAAVGVRQLFGMSAAWRATTLLALTTLALLTAMTWAVPSLAGRFLVMNVYGVGLLGHLARQLHRHLTWASQDTPMQVIFWLLLLAIAGFAFRQVWVWLYVPYDEYFFESPAHFAAMGPILLLINASALVTALVIGRDLIERLTVQAERDPLTALLNRRGLENRLRGISDERWVMAFIDVDHFKALNDRHGHAVGDAVLRELASRLARAARQVDLAARVGGEEFCLVAPLAGGHVDIEAWARRVLQTLTAEPVETEAGPLSVTVSMGCTVRAAGEDFGQAIGRADGAMYAAKQGGRDQVVFDASAVRTG